jgi:hypothetical protein
MFLFTLRKQKFMQDFDAEICAEGIRNLEARLLIWPITTIFVSLLPEKITWVRPKGWERLGFFQSAGSA